jgi:hypothetical protein
MMSVVAPANYISAPSPNAIDLFFPLKRTNTQPPPATAFRDKLLCWDSAGTTARALLSFIVQPATLALDIERSNGAAPCRTWLARSVAYRTSNDASDRRIAREIAVLNVEEKAAATASRGYRAAVGCAAVREAALRNNYAAFDSGQGATIAVCVGAVLKVDADKR